MKISRRPRPIEIWDLYNIFGGHLRDSLFNQHVNISFYTRYTYSEGQYVYELFGWRCISERLLFIRLHKYIYLEAYNSQNVEGLVSVQI